MALLKCRHCETEIDSNLRKTRCPGCGDLFPFVCAECETPLRPPFPVFDDERYLNDQQLPLCPEHFQRQCPRCESWFGANENPGYFLCKNCMEANQLPEEEPVVVQESLQEEVAVASESPQLKNRKSLSKTIDTAVTVIVFLSVIALVIILGWQIFLAIRPYIG